MAKRKGRTSKAMAANKGGQGKRLTPEQRAAIATAEGTLADVAKQFNTSINTVMRYRSGKSGTAASRAERPAGSSNSASSKGFIEVEVNGMVIKGKPADIRALLGVKG